MICNDDNSTEDSRNPSEVPCQRSDSNRIEITLPDGQTHSINLGRARTDWIQDLVKEFRKASRQNQAWQRIASGGLVKRCHSGVIVYYSPSMREIHLGTLPCKMWDCRDCGSNKASRRLEHFLGIITELYSDGGSLSFAEVIVQDKSELDKLRCRVRTNAHGKRASYFTAYRGSMLSVLATADISGRKEPTSMTRLSLPEAISKLVGLLSMPLERPEISPWDVESRYRPFTESADWRLPKCSKSSDWQVIATASCARIPHDVAWEMGYELGTKIRPDDGRSVEEFVEEFGKQVNEKDDAEYRESHIREGYGQYHASRIVEVDEEDE